MDSDVTFGLWVIGFLAIAIAIVGAITYWYHYGPMVISKPQKKQKPKTIRKPPIKFIYRTGTVVSYRATTWKLVEKTETIWNKNGGYRSRTYREWERS